MMDTPNPVISIIVPVYKVEPYLRKCLDSIVNQAYRNLEIILVDDGSPDRCGAICDEYAAHDGRIIVIHQENQGLSAARNAALDIATGDYVQFVDSDDRLEAEACERAVTIAKEQDADVVCFGHRELYPSGEIKTWGTDISGEIGKSEMIRQLVSIGPRNPVWNRLYARDLLEGIRFPEGRIYEDVCVVHELIHRSRRIYAIPEVFYNYIRHTGSVSSSRYAPRSIKDILFAWENRLDFLLEHYPEHAEKLMSQILWQRITGRELLKGDPDYAAFLKDSEAFDRRFRSRFRSLSKYSGLIRLYWLCPPLALLYVKWRYHKHLPE